MDSESSLGQFIRTRRKELGISQRDLAAMIGVSSGYMSLIENGRRQWPQKYISALAQALEVHEIELARAAGIISETSIDMAEMIMVAQEVGAVILRRDRKDGQPPLLEQILDLYRNADDAKREALVTFYTETTHGLLDRLMDVEMGKRLKHFGLHWDIQGGQLVQSVYTEDDDTPDPT